MEASAWTEIVADLNAQSVELCVAAASRLHAEADSEDIPKLIALLESGDFFVREAAAWPLAELAGPVTIVEHGAERGGDFCASFRLTPRAAAALLSRARIVSLREIYDYFDTAPCYVRGNAEFNGSLVKWELRALGTGTIQFVSTDEVLNIVTTNRNRLP